MYAFFLARSLMLLHALCAVTRMLVMGLTELCCEAELNALLVCNVNIEGWDSVALCLVVSAAAAALVFL